MPAVGTMLPVRMDITIPRTHRLPMSANGNVARAVPAPITVSPDKPFAATRLDFDDTLWWGLWSDHFNVLGLYWAIVNNSAFMHDATAGHSDDGDYCYTAKKHSLPRTHFRHTLDTL
jgi:hypothetical protein